MGVANATVDLAALKSRYPLNDVVEGCGRAIEGKGESPPGRLSPSTRRTEGIFTAYGDSQRYYCFGCGEGGDALDFIQRMENLTLPEAIRRTAGRRSVPGSETRARPTRAEHR